jgi:hypothetical protein
VAEEDKVDVSVTKSGVDFKGSTTQMLIIMVILVPVSALGVVLHFLQQHELNTASRTAEGHKVATEFVGAVKDMASAQREMTCIMALPPEKREADYNRDSSFCKRMAKMQ